MTRSDSLIEAMREFCKDWTWVLHETDGTFDGEFPLDDTARLAIDFDEDTGHCNCRRVRVERLRYVYTAEAFPSIDAPFTMLAFCDNGEDIGAVAVPAGSEQQARALAGGVSRRWLAVAAIAELDERRTVKLS